jgi:DNA-binding response OmpR family regulator
MSRILLIEDDEMLRNGLKLVLERAGHQVETACDGRGAEAQVSRFQPDLVVTDILMPGRDGLETIRALATNNPAFSLLAISGGGRLDGRVYLTLAQHLGATATLAKPFSNREFLKVVEGLLPQPAGCI